VFRFLQVRDGKNDVGGSYSEVPILILFATNNPFPKNQVVRKVTPGDPFSQHVYEPLPARQKPSAVFIQLNLRNYMFLYGGHDCDTDTVKGDLIAVDLDHLMWWFVPIDPGVPRFAACMVAVGQSLYIFGGCRHSAQGEGEEDIIRSFSVVEYVTETGTWNWQIPERGYDIDLGYDIGGMAVFEGQKILLLAGRNNNKEVSFHPSTRRRLI
jgi:hypothetical protein